MQGRASDAERHSVHLPNAGEAEAEEMAAAEAHILSRLGWAGQGLIEAAGASGREDPHEAGGEEGLGEGGRGA